MHKPVLLLILFAGFTFLKSATYPTSFSETQVVTGLSSPTAMTFAPDGRLFVCEQGGRLRVIKNGLLLSTPFLTVNVNSTGERGLLGVAFDPDFNTNQYVYIYYTAIAPAIHNRVSRFTASGDTGNSEVVVLELENLSSATNHNGGALHFGPDGKLYVAVGDNASSANSQSLSTRLGKMLRINPDGSIPSDNPYVSSTTGSNRAIWAMGLRNPFTFAVQPGTGRILINDVGENTWEEINDGLPGSNYGWPATEGSTANPSYRSPIHSYSHGGGGSSGCAITGSTFYNPTTNQYPAGYSGVYFFADYCNGWIRKLDPANGNTVSAFASGIPSAVDLSVGPDGLVYYLTRNAGGAVYRITYNPGNQPPTITSHPQNTTVAAGQSATFNITAAGSQPLNYQWQRNGAPISGATSSAYTISAVSASDDGVQFRCVVSNTLGAATSNAATLTVTAANARPTATISSPAAGTLYTAGSTINYSGAGADAEDGTLPASAFTWQVDFHHDTHTHPHMAPVSGAKSGSFAIPNTGETSSNVWYRIYLTVRDSGGQTHTIYRDILPAKVTVTLASSPNGRQLTLDGQPVVAPYSFVSVVGLIRSIGAVSPQSGGGTYLFQSWSDGGGQTHNVVTPGTATTYTASFNLASPDLMQGTYSFNEGMGTMVNDTSGNQNTGAITGAAWTNQGKYGKALAFNGVSGFISINDANSLDLSTGTLEAWVQLSALGRWHGVIAKGTANDDGRSHNYAIEINAANRVICSIGNGVTATTVTSTSTVSSGQFIHLAFTFDGANLRLYINGVLNSSTAITITPVKNTSPVYIGQYGGNSDRLQGVIDEVRIYNRALSAQEIQSDMNNPIQQSSDTVPPAVTITSPANGSTISNTITISADATDNTGVAGVQFLLNGSNLGVEDTTAPYSISWNTTTAQNGSHVLSARARDTGGNTTTSASVSVNVSNASPSELVSAYSFNEGTGTVVNDTSGNQNTGAITGATWTKQGKYGKALSFNGVSGFISINDADSLDLSTGTLEAWVQLSALGRWHGVIAKGTANDDGRSHNYAIEINAANRVICSIGNGVTATTVTSTSTVSSGQFIHLAFTFDGANLRLYINGALNNSTATTITPVKNTSPVYIGQYGGNSDRLQGVIDEVRIYNRALSAQEIQADAGQPLNP